MNLDMLLKRVEQAIHCNKSLFWDVAKEFDVPLGNTWGSDPTTLGLLIDGRAWESAALCIVRYARPDADLGLNWLIDGRVRGSVILPGQSIAEAGDRSVTRNADLAGAVILAALLRALIAEKGG